MKKTVLLLTGVPGIGKSTLIRKVAERVVDRSLGGFITDEIRGAGGRLGFRLSTFDGRELTLAHVDIRSRHKVSRYGVDVEMLEEVAATVLGPSAELYLVDEIGKMECFSQKFINRMSELFDSGKPVVATVARRGGGFIAEVKCRPDVELLEVTRANRDLLLEKVLEWIQSR